MFENEVIYSKIYRWSSSLCSLPPNKQDTVPTLFYLLFVMSPKEVFLSLYESWISEKSSKLQTTETKYTSCLSDSKFYDWSINSASMTFKTQYFFSFSIIFLILQVSSYNSATFFHGFVWACMYVHVLYYWEYQWHNNYLVHFS